MDFRGEEKIGSSSSKLCTFNTLSKKLFTCNVSSSCDTNKSQVIVNITDIVGKFELDIKIEFSDDLLWHRR